jgi:hypothetical protein
MPVRLPEQLYQGKQQSPQSISTLSRALPLPLKKNLKKVLTPIAEIQYQRGWLQNRERLLPGGFFVCSDPSDNKPKTEHDRETKEKTHLMYSLIRIKVLASCLLGLTMVSLSLCPQVQAATDTPDPGGTCTLCTADGDHALFNGGGTFGNSAFGWFTQFANSTGNANTSVGAVALDLNGFDRNTAVGTAAMLLSQGSDNTAVGTGALENNNANGSTAVGTFALFANQSAVGNTAVGQNAGLFNDFFNDGLANFNDAVGANSLRNNVDGAGNNAFGNSALFFNATGNENTAIGDAALAFNNVGLGAFANNNTAVGGAALFNNDDGSENTVVGAFSGTEIVNGFNNTYVGNFVGTGAGDESSTIRINDLSGGNAQECFIGGIFNNFQPRGGSVVVVTLDLADDHLGWDIVVSPEQPGYQAPVTPQRSAPAPRGRSSAPTRPTLGKVEKLEATVAQQQKQIETLTAQLKEQAAQIQQVSAAVEIMKPAPRVVENR